MPVRRPFEDRQQLGDYTLELKGLMRNTGKGKNKLEVNSVVTLNLSILTSIRAYRPTSRRFLF